MALPSSAYGIASFTNPDSDLTDYVGFVDLSLLPQAWWDEVTSADGSKGRAGKDSDGTEIASHWVNFDDVAQTGQVWFKWSGTLASTGTQEVRVYPPQSGNTSYLPTDTFGSQAAYTNDSVRFKFENDPSGASPQLINATGNGGDGVSEGNMTSDDLVAGKLGSGWDFSESVDADASVSPDSSVFDLNDANNFAWRGWVNPFDLSGTLFDYLVSWGTVGSSNSFTIWLDENGRSGASTKVNINGTEYRVQDQRPAEGVFTKLTVFYNSGTGNIFIRLDSGTVLTESANSITVSGAGSFFLAARQDRNSGRYFSGILDEWILSKGANITEDYLDLEYANENDPATFWGTWTVEGGGGGGDQTITVAELGLGSGSLLIGSIIPVPESASGLDTLSLAIESIINETGLGIDIISLSVNSIVTEVGSGDDSLNLNISLSIQDEAGSAGDIGISVSLPVQDTGQGFDTLDVLKELLKTISDSGIGSDDITANISLSVEDEATGLGIPIIRASIPVNDSGSTTEVIDLLQAFLIVVSESGSGSSQVSISNELIVEESGTGESTIIVDVSLSVADFSSSDETILTIQEKLIQLSEIAQATDNVIINTRIQLTEEGFIDEALAIQNTLSVIDEIEGLDSVVSFEPDVFIADIILTFKQRKLNYAFKKRQLSYNFKQRSLEFSFKGSN